MNHRISYNEIVTTAAKALFALGVSPGVDVENAKNIAWLEASKLDGISILADEIAKIDGLRQWPIPKIEHAEEGMVITLEPSVAIPNGGMLVHEDNFVIRKAGIEQISPQAPDTIMEI